MRRARDPRGAHWNGYRHKRYWYSAVLGLGGASSAPAANAGLQRCLRQRFHSLLPLEVAGAGTGRPAVGCQCTRSRYLEPGSSGASTGGLPSRRWHSVRYRYKGHLALAGGESGLTSPQATFLAGYHTAGDLLMWREDGGKDRNSPFAWYCVRQCLSL